MISRVRIQPKLSEPAAELILKLINWPGCNKRGFSMPLAAAIFCSRHRVPSRQPATVMRRRAGPCSNGCVPAAGVRANRASCGVVFASANANSIVCCVMFSVTLARRGRPSGEKNSSDSSIPHDTVERNVPHWNAPPARRTDRAVLAFFDFCGVMK